MLSMKKMTATEMRAMVGCRVSYRSQDLEIVAVRPDMQMMRLSNGAIIKPSELAS